MRGVLARFSVTRQNRLRADSGVKRVKTHNMIPLIIFGFSFSRRFSSINSHQIGYLYLMNFGGDVVQEKPRKYQKKCQDQASSQSLLQQESLMQLQKRLSLLEQRFLQIEECLLHLDLEDTTESDQES